MTRTALPHNVSFMPIASLRRPLMRLTTMHLVSSLSPSSLASCEHCVAPRCLVVTSSTSWLRWTTMQTATSQSACLVLRGCHTTTVRPSLLSRSVVRLPLLLRSEFKGLLGVVWAQRFLELESEGALGRGRLRATEECDRVAHLGALKFRRVPCQVTHTPCSIALTPSLTMLVLSLG